MKTIKKFIYALLKEFPGDWKKMGGEFWLNDNQKTTLIVGKNGMLYFYIKGNPFSFTSDPITKKEFAALYNKHFKFRNFQ